LVYLVLGNRVAHARRGAVVIVASGDTEVTSVCDHALMLVPAAPPAGTAAT
jgi:hypothetical protein